jgi:hypothetical protein
MSNTKPMKNTMRKQSPMKMVGDATGTLKTVKAGIDKVTEAAAKGKAKKADAATTVKSKPVNFKEAVRKNAADRAAAKAAAKATSKEKPATGLRGKLEAFKAKVAEKKAAKAAAATTKAKPATKAETPMPKPNRPAPKAATTKSTTSTTKTADTPVMMKKMGKSSCGK